MGQAAEAKLALFRNHVAVEVFGGEFGPGAPFTHGCGVFGDAEAQEIRLVPDFDWFDEGAGGELAVAYSAWSCAFDAGADGVGEARVEIPFGGLGEVGE